MSVQLYSAFKPKRDGWIWDAVDRSLKRVEKDSARFYGIDFTMPWIPVAVGFHPHAVPADDQYSALTNADLENVFRSAILASPSNMLALSRSLIIPVTATLPDIAPALDAVGLHANSAPGNPLMATPLGQIFGNQPSFGSGQAMSSFLEASIFYVWADDFGVVTSYLPEIASQKGFYRMRCIRESQNVARIDGSPTADPAGYLSFNTIFDLVGGILTVPDIEPPSAGSYTVHAQAFHAHEITSPQYRNE